MTDTKISALTELTAEPAADDELVIVDKSDTTMAASGTDKRLRYDRIPKTGLLPPTGLTFENYPRHFSITNQTVTLVNGALRLVAIWLPQGLTVTNISFVTGATALVAGTNPHLWFALYDSSRALLRQTADDTSPAWAASTLKTVNLTSPFVTTYSGLHYLAVMIAQTGGTMPNLKAVNTGDSVLTGLAPLISGPSSTGLTTTAPNPAGAISSNNFPPYGGVG